MEPRIAVVGAGRWGKNLIRNFAELNVLSGVHDPALGLECDYCSDIDAVVIATPNQYHYPIGKECLLAGKDVFIEKPMTKDVRQAEELLKLAEDNNRILMTGHILMYHPAIVKLQTLDLGRIRYIHTLRCKHDAREDDVTWMLAPHDLSVMLLLMGPPQKVASHGNGDTAIIELEWGRAYGHTLVSWSYPYKHSELVVIGDKRSAVFDGNLTLYENGNGTAIPLPQDEPLRLECEDFIRCIKTRERPLANGREALDVIKVLCQVT